MKKIVIFFALCGVSSLVFANGLDLNFNDKSARITFFNKASQRGNMEVGFLFNEDDYNLAHFGMHIVGQTGDRSQGLDVAMGVNFYGLYHDPVEVFAVGLGGSLIFAPPQLAYGRLGFRLSGHWAPSVITFQDAKNMHEYDFDVEYQLVNQGFIYGGYRLIRLKLENDDNVDVDEGLHFGLRILF